MIAEPVRSARRTSTAVSVLNIATIQPTRRFCWTITSIRSGGAILYSLSRDGQRTHRVPLHDKLLSAVDHSIVAVNANRFIDLMPSLADGKSVAL